MYEKTQTHQPRTLRSTSNNNSRYVRVVIADALGAIEGVGFGARFANPWAIAACGVVFGALNSYIMYAEGAIPVADSPNNLDISYLIQNYPSDINPFHPITNAIFTPYGDSIEIGYWHNSIISNLHNSNLLNSDNNQYEVFDAITQYVDNHCFNTNINWTEVCDDIYIEYAVHPTLSCEAQDIIDLHNYYLKNLTPNEYVSQHRHLVDTIATLNISNKEQEMLSAYLSVARASFALWRPLVPVRGSFPCIIASEFGNQYISNGEELTLAFASNVNCCPLYRVYGPSKVEALCFYDQENHLTTESDEFLTINSFSIFPSAIESFDFDTIPQGQYPIHQTNNEGLNYILLNERID